MNLHKGESESLESFIWRLGQAKDSDEIDMNWDELADIINKEIGNEDMPYTSSAFRKPYQQAKRFYDAGVFDNVVGDMHLEELRSQMQELEKQKVKVRDERNELRRVIREEARKESYREQFLRVISEHSGTPLEYDENKNFDGIIKSDNDLVVSMTDLHTGIDIDNFFNKFNRDVLKDRLNQYLDKIFEVYVRHSSENVHVILSELISGLIHTSLRIESNQTVVEQFLTAMDYISEFLTELSYRFNEVNVYICPGNHSRIMANKNDALKGENLDHFALPFLEAKLQNFNNVKFHYNDIEESIAMFNVRGTNVFATHGDKDSPERVVEKLTMMFGMKPDIVMLGHRHTNAMKTVYDSKVLTSGCMSGSDNYCMDKRLKNKPEQVIAVVTDNGFDCFYDVKLN